MRRWVKRPLLRLALLGMDVCHWLGWRRAYLWCVGHAGDLCYSLDEERGP